MKPEDVRAACIVLFGQGMTLARYADKLAEVLDCHRRTVQDWFVHGVQGISAQAVRLALQTRFLEDEVARLKSRGGRRKADRRNLSRPEQFRFPV
jgi:hypothetical protein